MKGTLQDKIQSLQAEGYDVDIEHHRLYDEVVMLDGGIMPRPKDAILPFHRVVSPKGGSTRAIIKRVATEESIVIAEAWAECCLEDNYNRNIGAQIALGRAEKQLSRRSRLSV